MDSRAQLSRLQSGRATRSRFTFCRLLASQALGLVKDVVIRELYIPFTPCTPTLACTSSFPLVVTTTMSSPPAFPNGDGPLSISNRSDPWQTYGSDDLLREFLDCLLLFFSLTDSLSLGQPSTIYRLRTRLLSMLQARDRTPSPRDSSRGR